MAKVYFREGPRIGKQKNEIYYMRKGVNIVKIRSFLPPVKLTDKNILPRARYCHGLKAYQLGKLGFENCFEGTPYTEFLRLNLSYIPPYTQDFFRDSRYPPIADFVMSHGSLGNLEIGNPKPANKISGLIMKVGALPTTNIKCKDVSLALRRTYNWLEEGDVIKMFCFYYVGVVANDDLDSYTHPFFVPAARNLCIDKFFREFTINYSDTQSMSSYGFVVSPFVVGDEFCALCLADRNTVADPHPVHVGDSPYIGAFTAVARRNTINGIKCTTQSIYGNEQFNTAKLSLYDYRWKDVCIADWKRKYKTFKTHY